MWVDAAAESSWTSLHASGQRSVAFGGSKKNKMLVVCTQQARELQQGTACTNEFGVLLSGRKMAVLRGSAPKRSAEEWPRGILSGLHITSTLSMRQREDEEAGKNKPKPVAAGGAPPGATPATVCELVSYCRPAQTDKTQRERAAAWAFVVCFLPCLPSRMCSNSHVSLGKFRCPLSTCTHPPTSRHPA